MLSIFVALAALQLTMNVADVIAIRAVSWTSSPCTIFSYHGVDGNIEKEVFVRSARIKTGVGYRELVAKASAYFFSGHV